jgi:hypothetical protein
MVVWTAVAVKLTSIIVLQSSSDWKPSIEKACSHVSVYPDRYGSRLKWEYRKRVVKENIIIEGEELEPQPPLFMGN